MPIPVRCSECKTKYAFPDAYSGKRVRCKKCQAIIAVPPLDDPDDEEEVEDQPPPPPKKKAEPPARARRSKEEAESSEPPKKSVPSPVRSKLAGRILLLFVAGLLLGAIGGITFATSSRQVVKTTRTETPTQKSVSTIYTKERNSTQVAIAVGLFALAGLSWVTMMVLSVLWFAWAWGAVPLKYGGMPAAKAIGLLFVPLFNLYWMFRVIPGLSAALVETLESRYPRKQFYAGKDKGMAACVLSLVPFLNAFAPLLLLSWFASADRALSQLVASNKQRDQ